MPAAVGSQVDERAPSQHGAPARIVSPLVLVLLGVLLLGVMGYGLRARAQGPASSADTAAAPGEPLSWLQAQGTSLPGIGRVDGLALPCTAWLLNVGAGADASAYAITSGRCAGIEDSATVLSDDAVSGASVAFQLFTDAPASAGQPVVSPVEEIAWASLRGTDLAVLRLDSTYGELAASGIPAITAVAPLPPAGQLLVAGVPVTGGADGSTLRGDRCEAGSTVDLAEGPWVLRSAQASDCGGILPGSVGSPALDEGGAAVGMVVTTTISSGEGSACDARRPCEVESGMVSVRPDTTYLVPLAGLSACFTTGQLRLGDACPLENPATVVDAELGQSRAPAGSQITVDLGTDSGSTVGVRTGMLGATDCWSDAAWSTVAVEDDTATVAAPDEQGLAMVCVGSPGQPTPLRLTVTAAGPDPSLVRLEQTTVPGGVQLRPILSPPELASVSWTIEPGGGANCATVEGFVPAAGDQPTFVPSSDLPATVCVVAADSAGNTSAAVAVPVL